MKAPDFLLHRLEVQLKMRGIKYTFVRQGTDKFGQPSNDVEEQFDIIGIYHESNSYIQSTGSDATIIRTKKSPMILCLYEDAKEIVQGDIVTINDKMYKVSGVLDIQSYSVAADISLDEVI